MNNNDFERPIQRKANTKIVIFTSVKHNSKYFLMNLSKNFFRLLIPTIQ